MKEYKYTAKNALNEEVTGSVLADSEILARESVVQMGLTPIYIQSDSINNTVPADTQTIALKQQWDELHAVGIDESTPMHQTHDTVTQLPADNIHLQKDEEQEYYPLSETLRLYAGWPIAWYGLAYILGYYQKTRSITPEIPYVYGLLYSPLVLTLTAITFLFLCTHSLTRSLHIQGFYKLLTWVVAIAIFLLFRANV
jgi:hypothetical protein